MAVRKKTKVFFLTPTKKIKLRMACGLEKDVPGSEKREAGYGHFGFQHSEPKTICSCLFVVAQKPDLEFDSFFNANLSKLTVCLCGLLLVRLTAK